MGKWIIDERVDEVLSTFDKSNKYSRSAITKLFRLFLDVNKKIELKQFNTVFDVGANIGIVTHILHMLCPDAIIHSFEPIDIVFETLKENIEKNNLSSYSKIYNFGLFSHEGDIELYLPHFIPEGDIVTYTFKKILNDGGRSPDGEGHSVKIAKMRRLDDFVNDNSLYPDFIKIDAERAEYEIIKGGSNTLKNCKVALIECCNDTRSSCRKVMYELGYNEYHMMSHHDILFIRTK